MRLKYLLLEVGSRVSKGDIVNREQYLGTASNFKKMVILTLKILESL